MRPRSLTVQTVLRRVEYHGQVWFEIEVLDQTERTRKARDREGLGLEKKPQGSGLYA